MKNLILGLGKSGTTALVYKVAAGLPGCQAFSGGHPGKYVGDYENAVYKHTYEERKGKGFDLYREHLKNEQYDRKIWIARDPRDAAVSRMLYRWHGGIRGARKQYEAHLERVLAKERDPHSIAFCEICRYSGQGDHWPLDVREVIAEETLRYRRMCEFVGELGDDWFLFTYEDMVAGNYGALNEYLGFEVKAGQDVPQATGKAKVIRKKATGDWRHWFTEEDVELFRPAYLPYMKLIGYDCDDWDLAPDPRIEPEYSSDYMQKLPRQASRNLVLKLVNLMGRRLRPMRMSG